MITSVYFLSSVFSFSYLVTRVSNDFPFSPLLFFGCVAASGRRGKSEKKTTGVEVVFLWVRRAAFVKMGEFGLWNFLYLMSDCFGCLVHRSFCFLVPSCVPYPAASSSEKAYGGSSFPFSYFSFPFSSSVLDSLLALISSVGGEENSVPLFRCQRNHREKAGDFIK